jgi:hypothetical protein
MMARFSDLGLVSAAELISDNYNSRLIFPKFARLLCSQKTDQAHIRKAPLENAF